MKDHIIGMGSGLNVKFIDMEVDFSKKVLLGSSDIIEKHPSHKKHIIDFCMNKYNFIDKLMNMNNEEVDFDCQSKLFKGEYIAKKCSLSEAIMRVKSSVLLKK